MAGRHLGSRLIGFRVYPNQKDVSAEEAKLGDGRQYKLMLVRNVNDTVLLACCVPCHKDLTLC